MKNILLVFLALVTASNAVPPASGQSELVMKVEVSDRANNSSPVQFDLVLVTDEAFLEELGKISAGEWFEKRDQYRLDHQDETGLTAGSWEWAPGQEVEPLRITVKPEIVGGVVFASYSNPGAHSAVIDPRKPLAVTLGEEDFTVTQEE